MADNSVFKNNINFLKNNFESDYNFFIKKSQTNTEQNYNVVYNKSNIPIPVNISKKKTLYDFDKPFKTLKLQLKQINPETEFILSFGFAFGYHIPVLLELFPNKTIIIFENDPELFKLCINFIDISKLLNHPNIIFFFDIENDIIKRIEQKLGGIYLIQSAQSIEFSDSYKQLKNVIEGKTILENRAVSLTQQTEKNIATLKKFDSIWSKNIFNNLKTFIKTPGIEILNNIFSKSQVLIIGAGPSLDYDINFIKKNIQYFIIVCVDTAVKKLIDSDIIPDFIICIDSSDDNLKYLKNVKSDSILIADLSIPKSVYNNFKNQTLFVQSGHSLSEWIDKFKKYKSKTVSVGTVSAAALDIAYKLGTDNIYFMGLDFAYTDYKNHYSDADTYEQIKQINKFNTMETLFFNSINDEPVYIENKLTDIKFLNWKKWFESQIKILSETENINFFNVNSKGLKIKYTKNINIHNNNIDKNINKTKYYNTVDNIKKLIIENRDTEINSLFYYKKIKSHLNVCIDLINKNKKYLNRIIKNPDSKNFNNFYLRIIDNLNIFFRKNYVSDILRWNLFLTELNYRKLNSYKPEKNISELQIINFKLEQLFNNFNQIFQIN